MEGAGGAALAAAAAEAAAVVHPVAAPWFAQAAPVPRAPMEAVHAGACLCAGRSGRDQAVGQSGGMQTWVQPVLALAQ